MRQIVVLAVIVFSQSGFAFGQNRAEPSAAALIEAASRYVARFVQVLSNVVAEERYLQIPVGNERRTLRADFLLVRPDERVRWMQFRDVTEVDGQPVESRSARLMDILTRPEVSETDRARLVFQENARYNIGPSRTFNLPLLALGFLQASERPRFTFEIDKRDRDAGSNVWIVKSRERARPTVITDGGRDTPAAGRLWIDADNGQVLRTELAVNIGELEWTIATTFGATSDFPVLVPREMIERCSRNRGLAFSGRATYGRFRRFSVGTNETIK